MVLVDHQIIKRIDECQLIESFDRACVTNIGYDLRAKGFYLGAERKDSVFLEPNESAFVESEEIVAMPKDLLGRVALKNSRIRQGLSLDAPIYQPGHKTRIYFRLTNVSANVIALHSDEKYATILFDQLSAEPDHPYNGAFRDEFNYRGMGSYKKHYKKQIQQIEKKTEDLKAMESSIYANVMVILTIFIALFSLLGINISLAANSATIDKYFIFNFLLLGGISFLVALLSAFMKAKKPWWYYITIWIPCIVFSGIALLLYLQLKVSL